METDMSNFFHRTGNVFDEMAQAFSHAVRYGARTIRRMSMPALLGCALVLAFIISILPLALTLFALFLVVRLVTGACGSNARRGAPVAKEPLP
jgi:hypothetical protein